MDLQVPEAKKDINWYREAGREFGSFFNRRMPIFKLGEVPLTFAQIVDRNNSYYFGDQPLGDLAAVVKGTRVENLPTDHNQIFTLINSLQGKVVEFVSNFKSFSELLNESAKSEKENKKNDLMFAVDNKEILEAFKYLSIHYNPIPDDVALKTKEDVEEYMEMGYRQFGALVGERFADIVLKTSDYVNLKPDQFLDLLIHGVTSEDRILSAGLVRERKILPESLILDLRNFNDNNFNDAGEFRGYFINLASPYEILEKESAWLSEDAIAEIKAVAMATTSGYGTTYISNNAKSPTGTFDNYSIGLGQGNPISGISGVRIYFRAALDHRLKKDEKSGDYKKYKDFDKNGDPIPQNQNKKGDFRPWAWHYLDLWGNQWVGKHGLCENQFINPHTGREECPQTVYIDGLRNGYFKSRVSRLINYEDTITLAELKKKEAQLKDMGVNHLIKETGSESEPGGLIKRVYAEFKSHGISGVKMDPDDDRDYGNFAETVDSTKTLSVIPIYESIIATAISRMSTMMHLPDVSQGLQQSVIGKAVQATTVELANTGLAPLFNGFVNYIQRGLQMTCNKNKGAVLAGDENYARVLLGDRGFEWLKTTIEYKHFEPFEQFGIYIYPYDQMNAQNKAELKMRISLAVQAGVLSFDEGEYLLTFQSFREGCYFLRKTAKAKRLKAEAAAEQQRMDSMMMAQAQQEAQLQGKQIPAQAALESSKERAGATRYQADKKAETDKDKMAVDLFKGGSAA